MANKLITGKQFTRAIFEGLDQAFREMPRKKLEKLLKSMKSVKVKKSVGN